jgi:NAD(P)-dependent dehydrogenase (short-subunit alcohol dehydrogenase family)
MAQETGGKVAVVTGAAGGIGQAIVRRLAAGGFTVLASDLNEGPAREVVEEVGGLFQAADVTSEEQVAALVERAVSDLGGLDALVSNAAQAGALGPITDITAEAWKRTVDVVLNSCFYGTKHAARAMIAAGRGGAILMTTSISGQRAVGGHPYIAAKHGLTGLIRATANDLAPHRIRVNGVAPGYTLTPMTMKMFGGEEDARKVLASRAPLGLVIEGQDIAEAFGYLASDAARAVTGQNIIVDAGFMEAQSRSISFQRDPDYLDHTR